VSWWIWLAVLLLVGSLLSGGGEVVLGMVRGNVGIEGVPAFVGNWVGGFYHWDRIGVVALSDFGAGAVPKITVFVVGLVYVMMFRLFYKVAWVMRDFIRRKGITSKSRAKLMCYIMAVIMMGIFTWGFEFPRAIVEAIL